MNPAANVLFVLAIAIGAVGGSVTQASELQIDIQRRTDPGKAEPDGDPVQVNFEVLRDGEPVESRLHVTLDSPEPGSLWSTDFPVVEGTRLMDSHVVAPDGQLELQYVFPIRGRYRWNVTATPLDAPEVRHSQAFDFTLSERPQEVINFTLLIAALAFLGLVAGVVLAQGTIRKAAFETTGER